MHSSGHARVLDCILVRPLIQRSCCCRNQPPIHSFRMPYRTNSPVKCQVVHSRKNTFSLRILVGCRTSLTGDRGPHYFGTDLTLNRNIPIKEKYNFIAATLWRSSCEIQGRARSMRTGSRRRRVRGLINHSQQLGKSLLLDRRVSGGGNVIDAGRGDAAGLRGRDKCPYRMYEWG
jgi:hypothetical protein